MPDSSAHSGTRETSSKPVVMILGDAERAEMLPLVDWLDDTVSPKSQWIVAASVHHAVNESCGERFPDLVVVLQSWPSEFSRQEVNDLLVFAPLARIVVCYGSWCESDGRNHNVWPQGIRVPLWAAGSRIQREWEVIRSPGSRQPIPWSASREEAFTSDHPPIGIAAAPLSFAVDSPDPAYRQFVVEIMTAAGHRHEVNPLQIVMFDADPWGQSRSAALRAVRTQFPNGTLVAMVSLPSPSLAAELHECGVHQVLPKLGFCGLHF